jgi:hypothetical protein
MRQEAADVEALLMLNKLEVKFSLILGSQPTYIEIRRAPFAYYT